MLEGSEVTFSMGHGQELDKIFKGMEGVPEDPWRADGKVNSTAAKGEVSLNLVDLMEFSWLHSGSLKGM